MSELTDQSDQLAIALFSEIFMADQLARARLAKALPKGMELSHFSVLHHLARGGTEKTPAELARAFHVTRGAMSNAALQAIAPILADAVEDIGVDKVKAALPVMRELRGRLDEPSAE